MTKKLRVMLVDDHEVVRQGLRSLLEAENDIEVVAEAGSGRNAVDFARTHKPEVVVMDVRMPEGGGVVACREIRNESPDTQVIMLTSFSDDEALFCRWWINPLSVFENRSKGQTALRDWDPRIRLGCNCLAPRAIGYGSWRSEGGMRPRYVVPFDPTSL